MPKSYEYLIIGSGPAGVQMAYFLQQSKSNYVVLEKSDKVASFFRVFPRRRELISYNKVHSIFNDPEIILRWDWNSLLTNDYGFPFRDFSQRLYPHADELVNYLESFTDAYNLNICYNTKIIQVKRKKDGGFEVCDDQGVIYLCRVLIVATGFSKPYIPDIPGIELTEDYEDVSLENQTFAGKQVLILGKGNSAFEIADIAIETAAQVHIASPNSLTLAWQSRHPGHVRANHTRLLDTYQLKLLNGTLDCHVKKITKATDGTFVVTVSYVHADGEVEDLVYDRIIRCTGFSFNTEIYTPECKPDCILNGRLPAITPYWESTNVSDLFFAGTLMQGRDFKKSSSAFIDGFRYNIRSLYRYLKERYENIPLEAKKLAASPSEMRKAILTRSCRTSGLWTQFGYLCDVFIVNNNHQVSWYEELPVQALREGQFSSEEHYYSLTFEWGKWDGDVMAIERHPQADTAYTNVFLHPILRRYRYGELMSEHHILEDLFGVYCAEGEQGSVLKRSGRTIQQYHREEHEIPLEIYLEKQLNSAIEKQLDAALVAVDNNSFK
ncbi:MAG: NAD(P)-binding domain-containing protein [Symploca sp. SIO2E6]|nr:NAD(P)-binding domain-containing protein [Symploca sp. SIO2E6]